MANLIIGKMLPQKSLHKTLLWGGAPSFIKVVEARHCHCGSRSKTKLLSMLRYLRAFTEDAIGLISSISSKKYGPKKNWEVNPT
ncbi:hypothetical protein NPIL_195101 [Nephila pilipes]|uniref:Uncharacterized protein n=1 Tax=Nephila pilipes TaxID=299642 RepID=A0A8X6PJG1_NEPPI|nr:hypothetical protein NPIL_195101 [Nephila pilipes]